MAEFSHLVRAVSFLLFLASAFAQSHTGKLTQNAHSFENEVRLQAVGDAVSTLKEFGFRGMDDICHPSVEEFSQVIPRCEEFVVSGGKIGREQKKDNLIRTRQFAAEREEIAQGYSNFLSSVNHRHLGEDFSKEDRDARFYAINIGGTIISICLVAVVAGMFLGFLTLDPLDLRIKMRAAIDPVERSSAAAIFPLVDQNHRLLVTLLIMNALAYECLPLFVDKLLPTYLTIIFSVSVLLIFGEIVPSAIFTGPDQLYLASKLAPLVRFSMTFFHPLSFPLVKLLNKLAPPDPEEDEEYNRAELSALVRIQYEERMKAQKQRDFVHAVEQAGSFPGKIPHQRKALKKQHIQHMANQISAEKQRRKHASDDLHFISNRSWRRLKEEIMYTVAEKQSDSLVSSDGIFPGVELFVGDGKADSGGSGLMSLHKRTPSNSSISSELTPPLEQMAPPLDQTEVKAVEGALNLKTMCALDVYTPLRMIFAVPEDMELTKENIAEIYWQGYSRVPVYEPQPPPNEHRINAVKGILMTRQLILIDWDDEREVSSLPLYTPPCVSPKMNLVQLLHLLRKGGSLIAFVCAGPHIAERALKEGRAIPVEAGFMGLVTLQDVLESVLQEKIYDEEDVAQRHLASAVLTQWAANKLQKFMKQKRRIIFESQNEGAPESGAYSASKSKEDESERVTSENTPLLSKTK